MPQPKKIIIKLQNSEQTTNSEWEYYDEDDDLENEDFSWT